MRGRPCRSATTPSRGRRIRPASCSRSRGCRRCRRGSPSVLTLFSDEITVAGVRLELLRPSSPEALIDEEAVADDEHLPYWAELWPGARALAEGLPDVHGLRVVGLGCGLGLPSLVAAAKGATVTATDWSHDAIELLRTNGSRNGL